MGKILKALAKAGTKDKRWGNQDNWHKMGIEKKTPRVKPNKDAKK
jgi:hypothetical protein